MFTLFITFALFVQVTSNVNLKFFQQHCNQELVFNPSCIQRRWSYPDCVPWDTVQCKINRKKTRNYCINYDCNVSFFSRNCL